MIYIRNAPTVRVRNVLNRRRVHRCYSGTVELVEGVMIARLTG